jgi:hypothetical protein
MRVFLRLHRILPRRVRRIWAVARIELLQLLIDPPTISLIVLVPAIQIVLFGYAVNFDPRHIPIAIAGGQQRIAQRVYRTIQKTGYFTILGEGLKPGAAARMVMQGKALIGIELPAAHHSSADEQIEEPKVIVDATDPSAVRPAPSGVGEWLLATHGRVVRNRPCSVGRCRMVVQPDGQHGVDDRSRPGWGCGHD